MRTRSFNQLFLFLCLSILFLSCQKEVSFELGQKSNGSLQSSSGDCLPKTIGGTYKAGQLLTDSNYIDITVNVAQTGSYTISTDTVNGYYFKASGSFGAIAATPVRLKGAGTPSVAGNNNFAVRYDTSICYVSFTVLPGGSSGGTAAYTLQGSGGNCMNSSVAGTYTQATALTSSNSVSVQVNVTTAGTWNITTPTVSGFSFSGSGTFTTTGVQTIILNGNGTPTSAGSKSFSVSAGSSSCTFAVTVLPNNAPPAAFTLQGSPGVCMIATPAGTFTLGVALTAANTLTVQVNVTTVGQWSVTTNTVAGITFSGSGTFTTTGVQNIVLTGNGTPTASGLQNFTITAGSSSCTCSITVSSTSTSANEYFPLTANSFWTYDDGITGSDTLKIVNVSAVTLAGNSYRRFITTYQSGPPNDTAYYRKDATTGFYYNYLDTSTFSGSGFTFPQSYLDVLFLKNTLTTGATWNSDHNATFSGFPAVVRFKFTCVNASATLSVNGNNFINVYKITLQPQIGIATVFQDTGTPTDFYYAKGIGLVKITDPTVGDQAIRYWQVF